MFEDIIRSKAQIETTGKQTAAPLFLAWIAVCFSVADWFSGIQRVPDLLSDLLQLLRLQHFYAAEMGGLKKLYSTVPR